MRVIGDPVQIDVRGGQPTRLRWQARTYPVRAVLDEWRWTGRWWLREPSRDYWLLDAYAITAEVYRERGQGGFRWVLARLAD